MRITFANNYTTPGGRSYNAGTTAEVNDADARSLIVRGKARRAEPESAKPLTEVHTEAEIAKALADVETQDANNEGA